jgi:hypothetical protein
MSAPRGGCQAARQQELQGEAAKTGEGFEFNSHNGFFIGMLVFRQPPAGRRRIAFGLPLIHHGELTR